MVGIVVVSHSRPLAQAAVELALEMVRGAPPPIEIAAGLDGGVLGTDAVRVRQAIDQVASDAGVLVLMDLGSAVLSAELALDLPAESEPDSRVVLSDGPLVEGLVAAVTLAAAGAELDEVAAEASAAAQIKPALLGTAVAVGGEPGADATVPTTSIELTLHNQHGLHARPAARFVDAVRRFDAEVDVRNLTTGGPVASGRSVSALSTLGVLAGHGIEVRARGRQAREVLAAIAALVRRNFDEPVGGADLDVAPAAPPATAAMLAASPGIGIGAKVSVGSTRATLVDNGRGRGRDELVAAFGQVHDELVSTRQRVAVSAGPHEAEIFDAHLLLLEDDELVGTALRLIDEDALPVERAWMQAVDSLAGRFAGLSDAYMQARADDVRSVGERVLAHLLGIVPALAESPAGVVVAADLSPVDTARFDPARVAAIVTAAGSPVSHVAILARSLGIPAVVGAGEQILAVPDGTTLVVDGSQGTVVVDPSPEVLDAYQEQAAADQRRAAALANDVHGPAVTIDGEHIEVVANISSPEDAAAAVRNGADGVGLLRTEFLFLDRLQPPSEDEQVAAYLAVADALQGRRLTARTLDIGGDKPVPYLPVTPDPNPFLGRRGLRVSLQHPELFMPQLRALVRTGLHHPVSILFPMVTTIAEVRAARELLARAAVEVGCPRGELPVGFEVGVMVEVPGLALRARAVAPLVDLLSIGTNDLTQYTLAAERGNAAVAALADPLDPAILRLIAEVTQAAGTRTRVAVCGEMASDPDTVRLLIGLGIRELSVSPPAIPAVKHAVRSLSATEAATVATAALQQESAADVRALLS